MALGAVFVTVIFSKMFSADLPEQNKEQIAPLSNQFQEIVDRFKEVAPKPQANYKAYVKRVVDGDTFIDDNGKRYRIAYIDAPESNQVFGAESSAFLKTLIENKDIRITELYLDKYERAVVIVYLDGVDIAEYLVQYGYAWNESVTYKANKEYISKMNKLEIEAKSKKAGLWAFNDNKKPSEYRKIKND